MSAILKFIRENHILALIEQAIAKKKSRLSLNGFDITDIPSLLYTCTEMEHLYLHRNKICALPVQIIEMTSLTTLTLDYNNITSLPPEIGGLKSLVNFNISYNPLSELTPAIGQLENLEAFWCNSIGVREIPREIGNLSKLDTFGARGNKLKGLPDEFTQLTKLRWLTLEKNQIEKLPEMMDKMESLVHVNLRKNHIVHFPESILKCPELMYLQLNGNQISILPEDLDTNMAASLEIIDLRCNPVADLPHPDHPLVRYTDELPRLEEEPQDSSSLASSSSRGHVAQALVVNATALRLPAVPAPTPHDAQILDIDLEASSAESSEDWENSVNSSEIDVQYLSDDERGDNEAVGMVFPELSRYASTAS